MTILQKHLVFVPICFAAFAALFGWIVMLLWNWLMPEIFGLPVLGFWQSVGLLVLCKLLFGGLGFGGHHGHHGHHGCHAESRNRLRDRWAQMSPEEREQIIDTYCRPTDDPTDTASNGK